jgi:predicted DNA-binding transcriptional regulator YafY
MRPAADPTPLPPVVFSPEEAAAVAVALAAAPVGPWADAGPGALEKVLAALEPHPDRRAALVARCAEVAGRSRPGPAGRPALVVLPGGRG